ncbi:MAG: cytochrome P450 [Actinobacteria bacterium 13_2_20CM_2_72_6]|nr:MAG: cytochrome P450 [Actinobacteria bacterium 13_2_20CM_2_72_6]
MTDARPPLLSGARPIVGHIPEFMRDPIATLARGHREQGDVFGLRIGPKPTVVLLGPEHNRFFFAETDKRLSIRSAYPFFMRMFDDEFYFMGAPDEYRRQRALVLPRFQGRQLNGYITAMAAQTRDVERQLGDSGEFDLIGTLGPLVMRIAAHAFLGPELGSRLGMDFFERFRRFSGGMEQIVPLWVPIPRLVRARRARDDLRRLVGDMIRERRARPVDPPDFLQTLTEARYEDGEPVPDLVLINLILMLTWAGHETTAGHVSWAFIDLLRHPEELSRVRAEQNAVLDGTDEPDLKAINRLTYLDWALHETERLHPVAYAIGRSAAETFEYQGYEIRRGTNVMISPAVSHRLPEIYPEPDEFRPARFESDPRGMHGLAGFGGGVHRCLGVHFAYLEMKVIIAMLLRDYDLELVDPDPQPIPGTKTKWPQSPCRVRYRRKVTATV